MRTKTKKPPTSKGISHDGDRDLWLDSQRVGFVFKRVVTLIPNLVDVTSERMAFELGYGQCVMPMEL